MRTVWDAFQASGKKITKSTWQGMKPCGPGWRREAGRKAWKACSIRIEVKRHCCMYVVTAEYGRPYTS